MNWAPVVGYEGLYEVSTTGLVRRCARLIERATGAPYRVSQQILSDVAYGHRRHYRGVGLRNSEGVKRVVLVHRLVAKAFIPNPEGLPDVNHKNLNKHDNRAENLEWVGRSDNQRHAARHGRFHGLTNPNARFKLDPDAVADIHQMLARGYKQWQIAARHGVSSSMISMIHTGRVWTDPRSGGA